MTTGKEKRGRYGDGSVYQNGRLWSFSWYQEERDEDGIIRRVRKAESSHSADKKVAQSMLRAKLNKIGGRRPTITDPDKVTYANVMENYFAHCIANKRRSVRKDRDGNPTLGTFKRLNDHFSGYLARDVTVKDLKDFRNDAKSDGLSDATANRYMATMRAAFRQAVKDEMITPTEMPGYFPTVHEPNEARGALFVKDEWYEPLKRKLSEPLRSAFIMCYNTGMRVHEMLRLRWRHFNFEEGQIHLPGEITKTGKQRDVFIPSDLKLKAGKADDLVFPLNNYRWQWYKACVAVKAGRWEDMESGRKRYVGLLLRHCRHTFVRNASDTGMENQRIMKITGHKTQSTFDRYNIGKDKDVDLARELLENAHKKRQDRL